MRFNNANKIRKDALRIEKGIQSMVTVLGNDMLNHFVESFRNQGFEDSTVEKWKPRKRAERGRSRAILVKTGDLRRSLRKVKVTRDSVTIASDKPYAEIHNNGLYGRAWGRHSFKMPKRQFMGESVNLKSRLRQKLNARINRLFNG